MKIIVSDQLTGIITYTKNTKYLSSSMKLNLHISWGSVTGLGRLCQTGHLECQCFFILALLTFWVWKVFVVEACLLHCRMLNSNLPFTPYYANDIFKVNQPKTTSEFAIYTRGQNISCLRLTVVLYIARARHTFSVKDQRVRIFSTLGDVVSAVTTQLCCCKLKVALGVMLCCALLKVYLQNKHLVS